MVCEQCVDFKNKLLTNRSLINAALAEFAQKNMTMPQLTQS